MTNTYVYRLQLTEHYHKAENWDARVSSIFSEHAAYLSRACDAGQALVVGRTDVSLQDNFGIVIFYAASESEARAFMEADPCVAQQIMHAELFPFRLVFANEAAIRAGAWRPTS